MSHPTFQSRYVQVNHPETLGPVVVSIPHAGRIYPQEILDAARVPQQVLERLEDGWCDLIAAQAVAAGATVVKAQCARAVADSNRAEDQLAAAEVAPEIARSFKSIGPKERAGLGVVPTRLLGPGLLWKRPLTQAGLEMRLDLAHRPYHHTLQMALDAAHRACGIAILIDLHSMPTIPPGHVGHGQGLIIGDRFGEASGGWLAAAAIELAQKLPFPSGLNRPYAGGYILQRHTNPAVRRFGIQLEFDRQLYLNAENLPDAAGLAPLQSWLAALITTVASEAAWPASWTEAAE